MKEDGLNDMLKSNEDDIGFLLWRIMKLWQRERQKELDEFNTTGSQLELLFGIYFLNDTMSEVTQIVLSHETGIDPMTTSTILRNLEKRGLVARKPSKTDTRARAVEITDKGKELLIEARSKMKFLQKSLLSEINFTLIRDELQKLLNILENKHI